MRRGGATTTRVRRAWARRGALSIGLAGAVVAVVAAAGLFTGDESDSGALSASETTSTSESPNEERADERRFVAPTTTIATAATTSSTRSSSALTDGSPTFVVTSVIDGDTVRLDDGRQVRLAQVDAPETNQCYGSKSTQMLTELVDGKTVTLRRPAGAPKTDRYGRTLAELFVDGSSTAEELVRNGAAEWYEQYAHEDADLAQRLQVAEVEAATHKRGLWSTCTSGVAPPPAATSPPTTIAAPQPLFGGGSAGAEASSSSCHPAYPDDCIPPAPPDLNCGSESIRRRVRVDHAHGDPHGFDANHDGWGCESYG